MSAQKILGISLISTLLVFANAAFSLEEQSSPAQSTTATTAAPSTTETTAAQPAPQLQSQLGTLPIPTPEEDTIITDSIKKQIANSSVLSRFNIDVSTQRGVVTLKGNVNSNNLAANLIELAQSIVGVRDVTSRLTVQRSQQVLTDTIITAKIKGLFIRERLFGTKPGVDFMNVETKNGIVFLTGSINNKKEVDRAIEIIQGVSGVKGVEYRFSKILPMPTK